MSNRPDGARTKTRGYRRALQAAACLLALLGGRAAQASSDYRPAVDAWPLVRYWTSADKKERHVEALWPVGEYHDTAGKRTLALRPFYNHRTDKQVPVTESEWPWPIGFGTHRPDLDRAILYPLFQHDRERFSDGRVGHFNVLLPLFYQRSGRGPSDLLVFPLGGVIHNILGREKVVIFLWPLYVYQRGREAQSWDFPQPFLRYVRWDDGGRGYKAWPLFGVNRRPGGKLLKVFALWPFLHYQHMTIPQGELRRWWVFPLVGRINDPGGYEWSVLWPFMGVRYEKAHDQRTTDYFWPFAVRYSGGQTNGWMAWPLCGATRSGAYTNGWFAWPFGWYRKQDKPDDYEMGLRVVPLAFFERERRRGAASGAWQLWPLVKVRHEADATAHVELPSFFPARWYGPYERNIAPFFRALQYDRTPDGTGSYRLLWRVARVDTGPEKLYVEVMPVFKTYAEGGEEPRRGWNVLKGLFGVDTTREHREYRFLYFITYLTSRVAED